MVWAPRGVLDSLVMIDERQTTPAQLVVRYYKSNTLPTLFQHVVQHVGSPEPFYFYVYSNCYHSALFTRFRDPCLFDTHS
jgi:hypothetical protein